MDCLGGAQGPSEQSSEIQSVKTAMGSGVPLTQGSVRPHVWREDPRRGWGEEPRTQWMSSVECHLWKDG